MIEEFTKDLYLLYGNILRFKERYLVEDFKSIWEIKENIGEYYEKLLLKINRKKKGSFYTPQFVCDYINNCVLSEMEKQENTNIKILDPSCGGGYFLIDLYKKLEKKLEKKDIIENMLYGIDLDEVAIIITKIELFYLSGYMSENIKCRDFLLDKDYFGFNYIVGNPPYIGHKMFNPDYKCRILEPYKDVFYGKADLSYCFIKSSLDKLEPFGKLIFFTSRYILESLYGEGIRDYIMKNSSINKIIDFYGTRVIKGVGVDNIIIFLEKSLENSKVDYFKVKSSGEYKGNIIFSDMDLKEEKYTKHISINKGDLSKEEWIFLSDIEKSIIEKIENKCVHKLKDICKSFQGIITGKDEAFIIDKSEVEKLKIEESLLKPWIKGKQISKFKVSKIKKYIIYTNLIDKEENYKNTINFIGKYKKELEKRRECKNGSRNWYAIQWARKREHFECKKIIFPYKSSNNKFSIDEGNYFSADIYSLKINNNYKDIYTYEFLENLLNSSLYEFYIKTISKKLGGKLYDYYPNKIMKILIPDYLNEIENINSNSQNRVKEIDLILNEHFNVSDEEFEVIKSWCD